MKSIVTVTPGDYGFGHNWFLIVGLKERTKSFFLGQDVKFCNRVLGMSPKELVNIMGNDNFSDPEVLKSLSEFIIEHLDLTEEKLEELNEWELCCQ